MGVPAQGYVSSRTADGSYVKWPGIPKMNLAGNPLNKSGLTHDYVYQAAVRSLFRWKQSSGNLLNFDYWQGTHSQVFETNSNYNGQNSLYFASQSGQGMDSNVIGLTQVWYDTQSGEILETDMVFNDLTYQFTSNPQDSSSNGNSRVFFENVLTHELGHAFGLSHSGNLQSTMLFIEAHEQNHLSCDDHAGIRALYGGSAYSGSVSISGKVIAPDGRGLHGAHLVAVSQDRGVAIASSMSDASGNYVIDALPPGNYVIYAEPFYAGAESLSGYYRGINTKVCSGKEFGRTFLRGSNGALKAVSAQQRVSVESLTVDCTGGASVSPVGGSSFSSAYSVPIRYDRFALTDQVRPGAARYYRFEDVEGKLQVSLLGYSLYSPLALAAELIDEGGRALDVSIQQPVFTGVSGYSNYDVKVSAEGLPLGDYTLKVYTSYLSQDRFPAGRVSTDSNPFLVMVGALNPPPVSFGNLYPENGRCEFKENFPAYQSPGGLPPRKFDDESENVGFCGTLSGPTSTPPGAIFGWFVPWLFMLFIFVDQRRRSFRSSLH